MWFTVCLHGIGMYMMTDCMHTSFPLTRTACGGIGVGIIHMAPAGDSAGDSAGDGVRRGTTIAGTTPVIGVAIGGITIIITTIPAMDGVVVTGEVVMDGHVRHIMIPAEEKMELIGTRM